jgi:hypothetical protein
MSKKNDKTVNQQYLDIVDKQIEQVQASGDIPEMYMYQHEGHNWVLTLPRSVMAQKRLVHLRNEFLMRGTYEAEEALLNAIVKNAKMDGRDVMLENLGIGEIEVLKIAYMDGLLLPLSLGGEQAVLKYMQATVDNVK